MKYKLACADLGIECSYVGHGKTVKEVIEKGKKHGKKVHGYTDKQLNDPEMNRKIRSVVKKA